jgi:hypothetical protein
MVIVIQWKRYWLWRVLDNEGGRLTWAPSRPDFEPLWFM